MSSELLIEEILATKGENVAFFLERYRSKPIRFKIKKNLTKLFYTLIFGILPVIPLLSYFEILSLLQSGTTSREIIFFMGGFLFSIYFSIQFLNFLLMGMMDVTFVISGKIFQWFETLPISRKDRLKLMYTTLFRNYDLPIITLFIAFPLTMFIGSGNLLIFLSSLAISFLTLIFSFNILILSGERINRKLDINEFSSRRTFFLRIFNILIYLFVIIGTYLVLQWALNSIEEFYGLIINNPYLRTINVILSTIPFPFNPSFIIALSIEPEEVSLFLWISTFVGLGLFLIVNYYLQRYSLKVMRRIAYSKVEIYREPSRKMFSLDRFHISVDTPLIALLKKDLRILSRDLKAFMSTIMSIFLSFIFIITFNLRNVEVSSLWDHSFLTNFMGILIISPILVVSVVYNLTTMDASALSINSVLPIIPRDQAKAKLIIIFPIITIVTLAPVLMFITRSNFIVYLLNFLVCLPYVWLFTMIIFVFRIAYFGKKRKKHYIMEEIKPENRFFKWVMITIIPYLVQFWLISFISLFYYFYNYDAITIFYIGTLILGFLGITIYFYALMPNIQVISPKELSLNSIEITYLAQTRKQIIEKAKSTFFSRNIWLSILTILTSYYILNYLVIQTIYSEFYSPVYHDRSQMLFWPILGFILETLVWLFFFPKVLGIPYGRVNTYSFLYIIGFQWTIPLIKKAKHIIISFFIILGTYTTSQIILTIYSHFNLTPILSLLSLVPFEILQILVIITRIIFFEIVMRGFILTMILEKYEPKYAIILASIFSASPILFYLVTLPFSYALILGLIPFAFSLVEQLIYSYIYFKRRNFFPIIAAQVILALIFDVYPISYIIIILAGY